MANHLYGYSSTTYGGAAAAATASAAGGVYSSRSLTEAYHPLSYAYLGSSDALASADPSKTSAAASLYLSAAPGTPTWPPGVDVPASASAVDTLSHLGIKRSSEALYNHSVLGAHSTIGQTEAWYSTNYLAKRSRFETASHLPIYPQRPGEKDCVHYMQTRTCKFGDSCKFDHPFWVPEGGIPDWKEVPLSTTPESLPLRPGAPDCPYFMKTQRCKFGSRCKFNHPQEKLTLGFSEHEDSSKLPERPSEPPCAFYMKTGNCKFGATCKFHHPRDIQILSTGEQNDSDQRTDVAVNAEAMPSGQFAPALMHNTKGLPIRPGEVDCPFYLKTGSCKYGATCRYNHPDRNAINPTASAFSHSIVASPAASLSIGVVNPVASVYQTIDPRLAQPTLSIGPIIYPQRPGQIECDYYMKTGECKFGERCKFHHPIDRSAPTTMQAQEQNVKLTLAGLPRREGSVHCPYYMKTGACKYGATCKFDHPPPGEVMSMATSTGDIKGDDSEVEAQENQ